MARKRINFRSKEITGFDKMSGKSIGIFELLLFLFIGLKLTHEIDWSWWWVLSPFWIPLLLAIIAILIWGVLNMLGWFE